MKLLDESVLETIELVLSNNNIDLIDVEYELNRKPRIIRFLIDKPGGVKLKDCEDVNKMIEPILDVEENISGSYLLEIASPGIDRPLKTESDFRRVIGELVKVRVNNRGPIFGRVKKVEDGVVTLENSDKNTISIPIKQIKKANIEIEF